MKPKPLSKQIADVIWQCCVAMDVSWDDMINSPLKAGHPNIIARRLAMYHLNEQGLSYEQIGKAFGKKSSTVRENVRYAFLHLSDTYAPVLDQLPKITFPCEHSPNPEESGSSKESPCLAASGESN